MPHVGKQWPYAWPLDWSLRYLYSTFWALPVRYKVGTGGITGVNASITSAGEVSGDFVYEPNNEWIYWEWDDMTTTPAGLQYRLYYVLTGDDKFFKLVSEIRNGGTVIYRGTRLNGFFTPNLWTSPGPMLPITPATGGNTIGGFQIQPAVWSDFPPDYVPPQPP